MVLIETVFSLYFVAIAIAAPLRRSTSIDGTGTSYMMVPMMVPIEKSIPIPLMPIMTRATSL
jgi:hypothetical protein